MTLVPEMLILFFLSVAFVGVVCGKEKKEEQAVVSSAKAKAKAAEPTEEYVPEVEEPRVLLKELPIETIEGIGSTYGEKLRSEGIDSVDDLLMTSSEKISKICDIGVDQADRWIAMSRFCWLDGISEEDAEAIVYATGIVEVEDLAQADPNDVLEKVKQAVSSGDVRVPEDYKFTLEMVKKWIEAAKSVV